MLIWVGKKGGLPKFTSNKAVFRTRKPGVKIGIM